MASTVATFFVLFFAVVGLAAALLVRAGRRRHRRLAEALAGLAAAHGLTPIPTRDRLRGGVEGAHEGGPLRLEVVAKQATSKSQNASTPDYDSALSDPDSFTLAVSGPVGVPPGFDLERSTLAHRLFAAPPHTTGDAAFDRAWRLSSASRLVALAPLDAHARAALVALADEHQVRCEDGAMRLSRVTRRWPTREDLDAALASFVTLRAALGSSAVPPAERLAARVAEDPALGARLQALKALAEERPGHEATARALRAALAAAEPELRLEACLHLPLAEAEPALAAELEGDAAAPSFAAALALLLDRGGRPADASLDRALAGPPPARALAARALALRAAPGDEARLLALLAADDDVVDVAAARALADVGGAAALGPLLAHTRGLFADRQVKAAARDAVAAIQGRLGVAPGQLSLAEGQAGELSLTPARDASVR